MKLSNIKILYKILACFVLLGAVVGGGLWYATSRITAIDHLYGDILEKDVQGMKAGLRANQRVFNFGRLTWRIIAETDMSDMQRTAAEIRSNHEEYLTNVEVAKRYLPAMAARFDTATALFEDIFKNTYPPLEKATLAGDNQNALKFARVMQEKTGDLRRQMAEITSTVEKDLHERSQNASAVVASTITTTIAAVSIAFVVVVALSFVLVQFGVTRPLGKIGAVLMALAEGDKSVEIPYAERKDEVGANARVAKSFKDKLIEIEKLEAEQRAAEEKAVEERKATLHKIADDFESAVGSIVGNVSTASTELEAAATTLTHTAETTMTLSTSAAAASEQASTNVQSVASAGNEMATSVNEISRQVQESTRIAGSAVQQAQDTDARINELSQAASRIGDVVKLITAIAEQTNLLALNATIEAARAGEAGKGFAVVAQEVKALAAQTGKATGEIAGQIASMQAATQESVSAIKAIGTTIGRISEISATIAAAVEEQGAATQEVARNIQQASAGTTQVARNITEVSRGASETQAASEQVRSSAGMLAVEGTKLKDEVRTFLTSVRTGPGNRRVADDPNYRGPERRSRQSAA